MSEPGAAELSCYWTIRAGLVFSPTKRVIPFQHRCEHCRSLQLEMVFSSIKKEKFYLCQVLQFSSVAQSCPTLCNPMDYSPSGSSVHGIFQVRILDWVAVSFSRDLPDPGIEHASGVTVFPERGGIGSMVWMALSEVGCRNRYRYG